MTLLLAETGNDVLRVLGVRVPLSGPASIMRQLGEVECSQDMPKNSATGLIRKGSLRNEDPQREDGKCCTSVSLY